MPPLDWPLQNWLPCNFRLITELVSVSSQKDVGLKTIAWMTTIARNRALDWVRRRPDPLSLDQGDGREDPVNPDMAPLDWSNASVDARALKDCLGELSKAQRDCILLAHVQGYTHDDISACLATPLGTIKSWIRRGLSQLKACLER